MKKTLPLLLCIILTACSASPAPAPSSGPPASASRAEESTPPPAAEEDAGDEDAGPAETEEEADPYATRVYVPDRALSVEETVGAYFEQLYQSYVDMAHVDISAILYPEGEVSVSNGAVWNEMLAMRRRLIHRHNLCHVETEAYPYFIRYIGENELLDERLEFWEGFRPEREGEITLHFVIEGEEGRVYPPAFAVNAQHSVRLMEIGGMWKISFHYYPGSVRRLARGGLLRAPTEEEMLAALVLEFAPADSGQQEDGAYDGAAAAGYARAYTEAKNPGFYDAGDWLGNCANFTSQCISHGFGGGMTASWFAGNGGGSPAWESVGAFWELCERGDELAVHVLAGVSELREGDLIQTAAGGYRSTIADDEFGHSLLVVDADTLLLAQNTPACFVYYSDLVNVETRFLRPLSLS